MVNWRALKNKIPHRVQVKKGAYYEICWIQSFHDPGTLGETRFAERQIVLKMNQSPKETVTTYLHELAHAVSAEYEIGLTESQVLQFEKSIYYLLKKENVFKGKKNAQ